MKRILLFIIFILTLTIAFVSHVDASINADNFIATVIIKIEKASFSSDENNFYVYSERENDGGFWVVDFKPKEGETLELFEKRSIGHYLMIKYRSDTINDDIEIISKYIW